MRASRITGNSAAHSAAAQGNAEQFNELQRKRHGNGRRQPKSLYVHHRDQAPRHQEARAASASKAVISATDIVFSSSNKLPAVCRVTPIAHSGAQLRQGGNCSA